MHDLRSCDEKINGYAATIDLCGQVRVDCPISVAGVSWKWKLNRGAFGVESSHEHIQMAASPSFVRPPVVESALGIQFDELDAFASVHFGLFYNHVKDRYPQYEEHPRLNAIVESFPRLQQIPGLKLQSQVTPQRAWYRAGQRRLAGP